jgi:hypothetical protein
MNLFEILEKEIIYKILPSDLYAILMLTSTSKTVRNVIFDNTHIGHKVKVCFKQSDYLYLENISNKFTIDKLYLQISVIQNSDIIFIIQRCPFLTFLSLTFLNDLDHLNNLINNLKILNKFKSNIPNCKVCIKYKERLMENLILNKFESNQINNLDFINFCRSQPTQPTQPIQLTQPTQSILINKKEIIEIKEKKLQEKIEQEKEIRYKKKVLEIIKINQQYLRDINYLHFQTAKRNNKKFNNKSYFIK